MSLQLRNICLLVLIFLVSSCGFKPLYAKKDGEKNHSCDNFTVDKIKGYFIPGQKMQYKLQDSLDQACINQNKQYYISMDIIKGKNALSIQKDREITRYSLTLTGNYQLFEKGADKPLYTGTSVMVGSYDAVTSDYGTYALEEDTQAKMLEEMANDITLKISSQLLRKK